VPNLLAVLLLSPVVVKLTREYLWSGALDRDAGEVAPPAAR
jgi:hypothetical protein